MLTGTVRNTSSGSVWTIESTPLPDGPIVHFAHATGMCAALYAPLLKLLSPYVTVVASDARGHGRTSLPAEPATLTGWATYRDDLAAVIATLPSDAPLILAGHSLGATVSMEVAARLGDRVAAVVMIEPAFVPFDTAPAYAAIRDRGGAPPNRMSEQAERRRSRWPSREAVRAAYHGRGVFATWSDAALEAYLDGGLRLRDDGEVELACTPAWEAATFRAVSTELEAAVTGWRGGLALLYASDNSTVTEADAATIVATVPGSTRRRFDGRDHFLPVHEPAATADAILAFA